MHVLLIENSRPPLAKQRTLDEVFETVDRVRVRPPGMSPGSDIPWPVLLETEDPDAIADLWAALRLGVGDPLGTSLVGPRFELFTGDTLVAVLSLQEGNVIHWSRWGSEASLRSPGAIRRWLVERGLDEDLQDLLTIDPELLMEAIEGPPLH